MGIILALAFVLRICFINQSLWLDESIEALALMGRMGPLLTYALADFQPPLYHLIGSVFTQLFGFSEIALRIPSLLSGLFTVYFVAKIGESVGSKKTGIIAGILAATSPLLIYYSVEGRTYAMTTFFVTASFYYFLQLLKQKNPKLSILYTLFTTLFIWTSYLSWFALLSQGLYVLWRKRYDILTLQIIAALTLFAWLPSFITSVGIGQSTMMNSPAWGNVVGGLSWKSLPLTWVKFVIGRISFDSRLIYGFVVLVIAMLHLSALKQIDRAKHSLLLVWLTIPVVLGLITASVLPVYSYFRVLFVLPAYLVLLAIGLGQSKYRSLTGIVIAMQLLAIGYFWVSPRYHREDWRSLTRDLPPGAVVAMPSRAQNAPLLYYGLATPIIEPSHDEFAGSPIYYVRYAEDLFDVGRKGQANLRESGYTITSQRTYPGIQLDIYAKE